MLFDLNIDVNGKSENEVFGILQTLDNMGYRGAAINLNIVINQKFNKESIVFPISQEIYNIRKQKRINEENDLSNKNCLCKQSQKNSEFNDSISQYSSKNDSRTFSNFIEKKSRYSHNSSCFSSDLIVDTFRFSSNSTNKHNIFNDTSFSYLSRIKQSKNINTFTHKYELKDLIFSFFTNKRKKLSRCTCVPKFIDSDSIQYKKIKKNISSNFCVDEFNNNYSIENSSSDFSFNLTKFNKNDDYNYCKIGKDLIKNDLFCNSSKIDFEVNQNHPENLLPPVFIIDESENGKIPHSDTSALFTQNEISQNYNSSANIQNNNNTNNQNLLQQHIIELENNDNVYYSELCDYCSSNKREFIVLRRITIILNDLNCVNMINNLSKKDLLHLVDIISISPGNEQCINSACINCDCDMISIDLFNKNSCNSKIRRSVVLNAVKTKNLFFEVQFNLELMGKSDENRMEFFKNLQKFMRFVPLDKIILTSAANKEFYLLSPDEFRTFASSFINTATTSVSKNSYIAYDMYFSSTPLYLIGKCASRNTMSTCVSILSN